MTIWKIRHKKTKLWYGNSRLSMYDSRRGKEKDSDIFWKSRFYKNTGRIYQRLQDVKRAMNILRKWETDKPIHMLEVVEIKNGKIKVIKV